MKQKNKKDKKAEDSIRTLMRKYAEWKEKREKNNNSDFEQYLAEEQEFLDFDKEI
jgi:hypothetical protein